jgi:hypothetical protein
MKLRSSLVALGVAGILAACGNNPQERTTGVGALAGPPGMAVGALVGGGAGAATGAATKPSQVNLGKPPWTNPDTRVPTPGGTAAPTSSQYRRGPDTSQNADVDRLNDQSLQAAQGGQTYR